MKPLNDRILAEKLHIPDQTAGGITQISENDDRPHYIKLLDLGPDVKGETLKAGLICLCGKYSGIDVDLYGRTILLREGELLCIVPDEDRWGLELAVKDQPEKVLFSGLCGPGALFQLDDAGGGFVAVFDVETWKKLEALRGDILAEEFITLTATRKRATGAQELKFWKVSTASLLKTDGQISARAAKHETNGFGHLYTEKA